MQWDGYVFTYQIKWDEWLNGFISFGCEIYQKVYSPS